MLIRLLVLFLLGQLLPAFAGNQLGNQPVIDKKNNILGYSAPYVQAENQTVMFEPDIEDSIATEVTDYINSVLVDIKLEKETSKRDYDSASQVFSISPRKDKRHAKNRIYVFLGSGFGSQFFANLRVYDTGEPTCFIGLRKSLWQQATTDTKKGILTHELFHCLGWAHPEANPFVGNFDFKSNDNVEVLDRRHDKLNTKRRVIVNLDKNGLDVVGFIGRKNIRTDVTTYTVDNQVKLPKGVYKIELNGRYIKKINRKGKIKYTRKIRKAKKFNLKNLCEVDLILREII